MNESTVAVLRECSQRSQAGTITFPEVVGKLIGAGVESYHADLYRGDKTYYMPSGESHIEPLQVPSAGIAMEFQSSGIEQAIRSIQRQEMQYLEFLRRIAVAGCVGYCVYITGRRAIYFGRTGDNFVEPFPAK